MSGSNIEAIISRQINHYNKRQAMLKKRMEPVPTPPRQPVVSISRQAGCCTKELAEALGERLGVQVWDGRLVDQIAHNMGLRREFVTQLDEGLMSSVETWVRGILGGKLFTRDDYALELASMIKTLAETGGAIFVGRGAGFILGDQTDLRLRLVAGEQYRLAALQDTRNLDQAQARRELARIDAARAAAARSYFKIDVSDPCHYDMVLNVEQIETGVIVEICECLVRARRLQTMAAKG